MSIALVTGSGGLIGAEAVLFLARQGLTVYGIDNDMRAYFFGDNASTNWRIRDLENRCPGYRHRSIDIRDGEAIDALFQEIGSELSCVIHAAAQPSHDWAAKEPVTDFSINALGTLNLLEALRKHAPDAAFAFLSTNKVYGDRPNALPLVETETRWEIDASHAFHDRGIDETMSIDGCMHSIFGVSKASADLMVQEYGRYFG
ncbi:MAG: NAD-dependent epimerase/dehydratase family protein, partial [Roseibium sp.]